MFKLKPILVMVGLIGPLATGLAGPGVKATEICDDGTQTTAQGTIDEISEAVKGEVWFLYSDDEQSDCLYSSTVIESKPPATCVAGAKFTASGKISLSPAGVDLMVDTIECNTTGTASPSSSSD